MAFLLEQVMPEGVTVKFLDEVTDEMNIEAHLPGAFVSHVHFMRDGRAHIVDVWHSKEGYADVRLAAAGASHGEGR